MRYLIRFIFACLYSIYKPGIHFLSLMAYTVWHGRLPVYTPEKLIRLQWESSFFYCIYDLNNFIPHSMYKTFLDYIVDEPTWVGSGWRTPVTPEDFEN